jgi:hypothetical protein
MPAAQDKKKPSDGTEGFFTGESGEALKGF